MRMKMWMVLAAAAAAPASVVDDDNCMDTVGDYNNICHIKGY